MRREGWILDLYPSAEGMTLWLLTAEQTVHKLTDRSFRPAFYVHAPPEMLRRLGELLAARFRAECRRTERIDLWQNRALEVLEVALQDPLCLPPAVRLAGRAAPQARLYDSDLLPATRYCWEKDVFPLGRVAAETGEDGEIRELGCEDDCWAPEYEAAPLRILQVRLAGPSRADASHGRRDALEVECEGETHLLDDADFPVAASFARLVKRYDPDLLLSEWGDATILPLLRQQAERCRIELRLDRGGGATQHSRARSYSSYGRILFKGSATTLQGRLHIDAANSFLAEKCELPGLWELVRVTKLPAQYAARTTPGTGISTLQMELAWRDGVLIPAQKAEPEDLKSPEQLLAADRGGLVFTPRLGLSANVAELDFVSEYPSIMARFNISPETVNCACCPDAPRLPELGYRVCQRRQGITSRVVGRLIAKRIELKRRLRTATAEAETPIRARRDALKWLLVCCFGYTGYKNARFGKIEAHEAINAVARETLLVAKETAEGRGFALLHALVDSLYVWKEGTTREECEELAREIETRTGLPIAVEAFYRFVVFLPSRQFAGVPVPNRFFAVDENGGVKARGLECRRHDTPPLIARAQREALAILAEAHDAAGYQGKWKEVRALQERYLERIASGDVDIEELAIRKRLTRPPREYQKASLTAIAAQQLLGHGAQLRPGQNVEYVITDAAARVPNDRVRACVLWEGWRGYDRKKYAELLREAFAPFAPDPPGPNDAAGEPEDRTEFRLR